MAIHAALDPFDDAAAAAVAAALGARFETLDGLGHWWMLQDSGTAAAALEKFWSGQG